MKTARMAVATSIVSHKNTPLHAVRQGDNAIRGVLYTESVVIRVFLASIAASALALAGCHGAPTKSSGGSLAGPMNQKERMRAEQWERATRGLSFDLDGGFVEVERIATGDPAIVARHLARGDELLASNRPIEAVEAYGLAARHDPSRADAFVGLGVALQRKGKLDLAIASLRTAVDLDAESNAARYELAMALWASGKRQEAIDEMNALLAVNEDHAEAHGRLAIWSYYTGNPDDAWRHLHRADALGQDLPAQFVRLLEGKMPDPDAVRAGD